MALRIEDYALIGDCETAALVGRDGSIDWLCWPRFDSDACFAALLGTPENGRWQIAPADPAPKVSRRYRDRTLILETEFETAEGAVTLLDFMPPRGQASDIVRLVVGKRGSVTLRTELVIRFDYGSQVPWVMRIEDGAALRAIGGPHMIVLRSPVRLHGKEFRSVAEFAVREGETVPFVLTYAASHLPPPEPVDAEAALEDTERFWRDWMDRCDAHSRTGPWSEAITRSLMTLKALTYAPTGGIVAAPTASLPENLGGSRNWDYRFCWLRDATLTLLALMNSGYYDEAGAWRNWLLRAVAGKPEQMQIMYGLAGERRLTEWEVPWLQGYANSRPVRIGNAAHGQLQLDVYGEVMDALHQARRGALPENARGWAIQRALLGHLAEVWRKPDHGIWEIRGEPKHFTHSKVMAWVAVDRAVKSVEQFGLHGPVEPWRALRQEIHEDVCRNGFDERIGSFVQSYGSRTLDASLLQLPCVGFLPPQDPRVRGTVEAIERKLLVDGFVQRYDPAETDDGLNQHEGAFLACSFWLADAYALLGRMDDARRLFERLLTLCNDVGLLSEEYDPGTRRQVGNFPQAFSHIALVNTAHNLTRAEKPAEQRADRDAETTHARGGPAASVAR